MKFHLFVLPTVGQPHELAQGMAGQRDELYQRMLGEIRDIARLADELGYEGIGFTEHHFHIEGFECSTNPVLLDLFVALQTRRVRVGQLGIVLPAASPLRVAEDIAILDQMSGGRAYAGFARGYQARWVIWTIPPADTAWPMPATRKWGRGVDERDQLTEVGITPRPLQKPHPPIYGPFAFSLSTVSYWARVGGIPVVLSGDLDFTKGLFTHYREEASRAGRDLRWGESIALGGFLSVAEDPGKAEKFAEGYRFAHQEWFTPFGFPVGLELIGDPDSISHRLETLHRALSFNEFFIWLNQGLAPHSAVLDSLELFAARVMPRFR